MTSFLESVKTMCARLKDSLHITATRYVPRSPVSHAPDIPSPLYPDRPIRPLPTRRLRSLLSPEVADAILYSPAPEPTSLFYYPYSFPGPERGSGNESGVRDPATTCSEQHHVCICGSQDEHAPPPEADLESDDEPIGSRGRHMFVPQQQQQQQHNYHEMNGLHAAQSRFPQHSQAVDLPPLQPKPPNSTSSSVDGYDSFENTKNKKKRKIPTPGSTGIYQNHLSAELANLDISSRHGSDLAAPDDVSAPMGQQYSSPAYPALSGPGIGSGISGSGSGRLARNQWRNGAIRSPLGISSDGSNAWGSGRAARTRAREWSGGIHVKGGASPTDARLATGDRDGGASTAGAVRATSGIIGTAIANAVQDTFNTAAAKDQENVSLLRLEASRKPNASNAQFTFTASSNVTWPGRETAAAPNGHPAGSRPPGTSLGTRTFGASSQLGRDPVTHGTQTNSGFTGNRRPLQAPPVPQYAPGPGRPVPQQQQYHPAPVPPPPQPPLHTQQQQQQQQQQSSASTAQPTLQPGKKTRPKRGGSQYLMAARERRVQQRYKNIHHPPSGDEIWICEFCEYESIFGTPPEALVRQYEINDLKERRRLEEKRRLLEKAKTKGRKGKKGGGKVAAKNPAANQQQAQSTAAGNDLADAQALGAQSDGYGRDEYYDGEDLSGLNSPTPPLPPPPPPPTSTPAKTAYAKGLAGGAAGNSSKLRSGGGEAIRAN